MKIYITEKELRLYDLGKRDLPSHVTEKERKFIDTGILDEESIT
jgi:hypothetical protein